MKNSTKFITGAVAGVALGVAATLLLKSQKGQKLQKDVEGHVADFYKYISPKLKSIEKMGKEEYQEFMDMALDKYAKAKKISEPMLSDLKKDVQKTWSHFVGHIT